MTLQHKSGFTLSLPALSQSNGPKGFTLIELLVVIVVVGIISVLVATNLFGARQRAQDSQKKTNLNQLKIALHSYYVDYRKYPAHSAANTRMNGCGQSGTMACPVCTSANFASGGTDGCQRVYAKKLEMNSNGSFSNIRYFQCSGGDDFRLKIALTNASDADILESQKQCPALACNTTYTPNDYVLCAN